MKRAIGIYAAVSSAVTLVSYLGDLGSDDTRRYATFGFAWPATTVYWLSLLTLERMAGEPTQLHLVRPLTAEEPTASIATADRAPIRAAV